MTNRPTEDSTVPMSDHETVTIGGEEYRRHPTHYYEDGNFIFLVETTAFRLFQGILTRRSAVIKDMLGLPQPKQSDSMEEGDQQQLTLDGVPVVELQDEASDFALLLDFMFPRNCLSYPTVDWRRLLKLVQIAQKYGVEDVYTLASKRLAKTLPTVAGGGQDVSIYKDPLVAVEVIESSRLTGLPAFLPLAFYSLSTMEWNNADTIESGALARLSARDQVRVHQGRASIPAEVMKKIFSRWENSTGGGSRQCGLCSRGLKGKLWSTQDDSARLRELLLHPLEELDRRTQLQTLINLCPNTCRQSFVAENGAIRKELLQSLGACFTLNDETTPFGGCP